MSNIDITPFRKSSMQRSSSTSRSGLRTVLRNNQIVSDRSSFVFNNSADKRTSELEAMTRLKDHEIERLEYMNNYLEMGIKKREEIIKNYFEENCKLKDDNKSMNKLIERLREELKEARESHQAIDLKDSTKKKYRENDSLLDSRRDPIQTLPGIGRKSSPQVFSRKSSVARAEGSPEAHNSFTFKVATVTATQGLKDGQSLFVGNSGKQSILDMDDEDATKVLNDRRLRNAEELMDDEDEMMQRLNEMPKRDLVDLVDTMKSLFNDFTNLFKIIISMKKLVRASHMISVSLVLNDALEKIVSETCEILNCDRASVFIVDEINGELWSKVAKGSNSTIRIPIDKGVVGYVATSGKAVRIDEAYLDPRFNKEVDRKTHYRTKTILCVPIKDYQGKIIGICQGINKLDGLFTSDDEGLMHLLANQAGVMLKNSIQYDKTVLSHHRLLRLLKIGNDMYDAMELTQLIFKAENGLKEVMLAEKAVIYILDEERNQMYRPNDSGVMEYFDLNCGIIGKVISTGEVIDISDPNNHPAYNMITDLDTSLPVLCMPIRNHKTKKKVGAFQVLNIKGVGSVTNGKVDVFEIEIIRLFCEQVAGCVERFAKLSTSKFPSMLDTTAVPHQREMRPSIDSRIFSESQVNKMRTKNIKNIWADAESPIKSTVEPVATNQTSDEAESD